MEWPRKSKRSLGTNALLSSLGEASGSGEKVLKFLKLFAHSRRWGIPNAIIIFYQK
jgi:hypothetical protein